jgi:hypothetical protein
MIIIIRQGCTSVPRKVIMQRTKLSSGKHVPPSVIDSIGPISHEPVGESPSLGLSHAGNDMLALCRVHELC